MFVRNADRLQLQRGCSGQAGLIAGHGLFRKPEPECPPVAGRPSVLSALPAAERFILFMATMVCEESGNAFAAGLIMVELCCRGASEYFRRSVSPQHNARYALITACVAALNALTASHSQSV